MSVTPSQLFRRNARKLFTRPTASPVKLYATPLEDRSVPAVTGLVFHDLNQNGIFEPTARTLPNSGGGTYTASLPESGVPGVRVTAYRADGGVAGLATTDANGQYRLDLPDAGPYRVEFTGLPAGTAYGPAARPGAAGVTAGTAVQFLPTGTGTANLSVIRGTDFGDNPLLLTNRYTFAGSSGFAPFAGVPAIVGFPYAAGASVGSPGGYDSPDSDTQPVRIPFGQVGATWGLGAAAARGLGFASAYTKRHSGYGPAGAGAVYSFALPGSAAGGVTTTATPWLTLSAAEVGAAALASQRAGYTTEDQWNQDADNLGWDAVGKTGFGGLAVNAAGTELYVMNLGNQSLYVVPINPDGSAGTPRAFAVPTPVTAGGQPVPRGDVRPFAVEVRNGLVYVGLVDSAESTVVVQNGQVVNRGDASRLRAYVYTFDPATGQYSAGSVVDDGTGVDGIALNFERGLSFAGSDNFVPWSPVFANVNGEYRLGSPPQNAVKYPQPMLTGLAFDAAGNLTLGFRTRDGDQTGVLSFSDPNNNRFPIEGVGGGDILKAFATGAGTFALERNAASPVPGNPGQGTGAGNNQGPGGGEFYGLDGFGPNSSIDQSGNSDGTHRHVPVGGVLGLDTMPDVLTTAFDVVPTGPVRRSGGVRWFDASTGELDKAYELYANPGQLTPGPQAFGKAAGVGDLIAVPVSAVEIGNRVWRDDNRNGVQDSGEPGLAGVAVDLVGPDGAVIDTAVTDAAGEYFFSSRAAVSTPDRRYGLTLTANTAYTLRVSLGGPLADFRLTLPKADDGIDGDLRDSDFTAADGVATAGVTPTMGVPVNHNIDLGLFPRPRVALGDTVWHDVNNDGIRQAGEPLLDGVSVTLLSAAGAPLGTTTTDANGKYFFRDLDPGTYQVQISTAGQYAGFVSSTGLNGSASGPFEPSTTTVNDQDHGNQIDATTIRSNPVTVFEPGNFLNPDSTVGVARDANFSIDFGLFQPLSVGDFVWNDLNNDGEFDQGEPGLAGVRLDLLNSGGQIVGTTTTNAAGGYLFTYLSAGRYQVRVQRSSLPDANFRSSTGAPSSVGPFEPQTGNPGDNFDHGTTNGAFVFGPLFDLAAGTAPTNESATPGGIPNPAADANSDTTQDFGFFLFRPLSIGNFVFEDRNNSGVFDAGDAGLDGFTVQLLNAAGQVLGGTTTANGGQYLFTDLFPGTYSVRVLTPPEFRSSTGTNSDLTSGPFEPGKSGFEDNQDHGTQGVGFVQAAPVTLGQPGDTAANPDAGGTANLRQDFGLFRPLSVGNFVWNDVNNSGTFDAGESPLAGVPVALFDAAGAQVGAAQTTDGNGNYLFTGLAPGQYTVRITAPAGFRSSTGKNGFDTGPFEPGASDTRDNVDHGTQLLGTSTIESTVTLAGFGDAANPDNGGAANLRQDFGLFQPLSIGDTVWDDKNNDGSRQADEPGLGGVRVDLLGGDGALLASLPTGADGTYLFTNLSPGTYQVRVTPNGNYVSSTGSGRPVTQADLLAGGPVEPGVTGPLNDRDHGTQVGAVVVAAPITLGLPGSAANPSLNGFGDLTQDFGLILPDQPPVLRGTAEVSGYVYRDTTVINGQRQPAEGETGIPGVTVTLTGGPENITRTAVTDANGFYRFADLDAGSYVITETQPPLFIDGLDTPGTVRKGEETPQPRGTSPRNDVLTVTLESGDIGEEYNFGEILPAAIFGYVYIDANQNCIFDPGETPLAGVPITISGTAFAGSPLFERPLQASDSPVGLTVLTDASGRYEFPVLPVGTYTLVETQPTVGPNGRPLVDSQDCPQEPAPRPLTVGNDIYTGVVAGPNETRGALNFAEFQVNDNTPSKDDFLGSSGNGNGQDPTGTPPITVGPTDLPMFPPFTVSTGNPASPRLVAAGTGPGRASAVRVFDYATGTERFRNNPYEPSFTGGVRVTTGDVDGDGVADVITATGPGGGPRVRVFSGRDGSLLREFFAYEPSFRGGVFVAAGDVDGDGRADIICGAEIGGGPRVTVFSLAGGQERMIQNFFAFDPSQRGGVRVAAADFTGDARADLVVATGAGVPTRVRVFQGNTAQQLAEFTPYTANFTGGVFVTAGDTNGDGTPDIITSADAGGGPHVQVFGGLTGQAVNSFFAYEPDFTGGARVAALDVNGDGRAELITTPGEGHTPQVKVLRPDGSLLETFNAFDAMSDGGVYVG